MLGIYKTIPDGFVIQEQKATASLVPIITLTSYINDKMLLL